MHVLKPSEIAKRKKEHEQKKRKKVFLSVVVLFMVVGAFGTFVLSFTEQTQVATQSSLDPFEPVSDSPQVLSAPQKINEAPRIFTGIEFRDLYRSLYYPNISPIVDAPVITGNPEADEIIVQAALRRGFQLTSVPVFPIQVLENEKFVNNTEDNLLQPLAKADWSALKDAAADDGVDLHILSGYRSIDRQRELFLERLYGQGVSATQIAAGLGSDILNNTLSMTALPGFSRHHTGYTIDLYCGDDVAFGDSICNEWISKNNYENAKEYGWIPSYPPDAGEQGPEPEPWEFVWVGRDTLR